MKKIASIFLVLLFAAFSVSLAQANTHSRTQQVVTVASGEVIDKDFFVGAGDIVEISGTVNGDVVIAGGQLLIDGVVNGDLLAAGGMISLSGEVTQDVRIVGGQLVISGKVGRNLTAVGGSVEVTESALISGGALFAGGNVVVRAPVNGDTYVGAGNLTLSDQINGDVQAGVGTLRLTSNAKIVGDFTYYSDEEPLIDKNASISGVLTRNDSPRQMKLPKEKDLALFGRGARGSFRVLSFLSALVFGLLMIRFFPNYTKDVAATIQDNLGKSLLAGILKLILAPIVALVLMITVIGIPLGLLLLFVFLIYIYLAKIFVAYCIGDFVYQKLGKKMTTYLPFIIGLLGYYLLTSIRVIGPLTSFVTLLLGLGGAILHFKECYPRALKSKVI